MADTFQETFDTVLDFHAQVKQGRLQTEFAPCFTPRLQKSMKTRDGLKNTTKTNLQLCISYAKQRNNVTKENSMSIGDYCKGLVEESKRDPKITWKTNCRVLEKISYLQLIQALKTLVKL